MRGREYITFCPKNKEPFKIPVPLFKKWVGELSDERILEVGLPLDDLKKVREIMSKESLIEDLDEIPYGFLLLAAFDIITTRPIKQEA